MMSHGSVLEKAGVVKPVESERDMSTYVREDVAEIV
jgi:hypothetical protein